jgi:hypothetical protein
VKRPDQILRHAIARLVCKAELVWPIAFPCSADRRGPREGAGSTETHMRMRLRGGRYFLDRLFLALIYPKKGFCRRIENFAFRGSELKSIVLPSFLIVLICQASVTKEPFIGL